MEDNNLTYKSEKDKYLYDYNLIQREYNQLYDKFFTDNDKYIKKYEESRNELNRK